MAFRIKEEVTEEDRALIQRTESELKQFLRSSEVRADPDKMAQLIVRAILFKFRSDLVEMGP